MKFYVVERSDVLWQVWRRWEDSDFVASISLYFELPEDSKVAEFSGKSGEHLALEFQQTAQERYDLALSSCENGCDSTESVEMQSLGREG